jgi:magnesium-transporting ATPase (P-type)
LRVNAPAATYRHPPTVQELHHLAVHEAVLLLESDPEHGLDDSEAAARRERFGPNVLPAVRRKGPLVRLALQFHHPLIYLLVAAGVVTAVLGEVVDASVIFGVVLINAAIGFVQESRAEQALEALVRMARTRATVMRSGRKLAIDSQELVPGDLVLLESGDKVPADLRLVSVRDLRADESALTGESVPVEKSDRILPRDTVVAERANLAFAGTLVSGGRGAGVVMSTAGDTELGRIHRLVGEAGGIQTPLTRRIAHFSKIISIVIVALAAFTFAIGIARGESASDMFVAAVALAVGAIPEGLPAAVTITLAIGVSRMARRRAIVRKLPAVETLGSTTVICSDKTGTLTENQMTVQAILAGGESFSVEGAGYAPLGAIRRGEDAIDAEEWPALAECLTAGALCNDARLREREGRHEVVGDPTEAALLVVARKGGLDPVALARRRPRIDAIPFESEHQYMATLHSSAPGQAPVVYLKGAPERVLSRCAKALGPGGQEIALDAAALLGEVERLAGKGLRVLAVARAAPPPGTVALERGLVEEGGLTLLGLEAMLDPPRPEAMAAVSGCQAAGIAVKMITGDHVATARAIAGRLHHEGPEARDGGPEVLSGADLAALPEGELADAVERASVFARTAPEQKLRLVEALQARGHVVAMTGDGVNDAPALKQADIGVAMGIAGTEVAKEASDVVLTDDDFATIAAAVEEGRHVFDNLVKFIVWTLPTNMGEGLLILAAIVAGATLPILPVQILWINMTTAVALGLMLAFEPEEPGLMGRPPRDPARPLLTGELIVRILLVSGLLMAGAFLLFHWEQAGGASLAEARTAAINVFVVGELFYLFNCRSLEHSMFRVGVFSNHWVTGGVLTTVGLQILITYAPFMQTLFHTAPLGVEAWLRIIGVGLCVYAAVGVEKWLRQRRRATRPD